MQRRTIRFAAVCMHIAKCEHVLETVLSPIIKAASADTADRILECSEEEIPDREVSEVVRVMFMLMMHPMRFGALNEIAQPAGRPISMVEIFGDCGESGIIAGRLNAAPKQGIHNRAAQD